MSTTPLARNEGPQFRPGALRSGHTPVAHATEATDTPPRGCRFYECLEPQLYNQSRMHSTLGHASLVEFETEWAHALAKAAAECCVDRSRYGNAGPWGAFPAPTRPVLWLWEDRQFGNYN